MALSFGEPAPWFFCATPHHPQFAFASVAGRYVLMGFPPDDPTGRAAAIDLFRTARGRFDDLAMTAFMVVRDPQAIAQARDELPGLRWFLDGDGAVSRLYGALDDAGQAQCFWLLLDPTLRVIRAAPIDEVGLFADLGRLPPPDSHSGAPTCAPVLITPRVFEPDICRRLIEIYEAQGGAPSGVMREVNGMTVPVLDDFKSRRDAFVTDGDFRAQLRARIERRLLPEIRKALQYNATRLERYIVARYDAEEGGYFRPHRDNTTKGTAHRRFAVTINLNAEDYEGGDLRFPEFGSRTYRAPTGGAVVFSCSLMHEAMPVTRGRRYAFLPFLYDEAAEELRLANLRFVADLQPGAPAAPQPEGA